MESILTDTEDKSRSERVIKKLLQCKKKLVWCVVGMVRSVGLQIYFTGSVKNIADSICGELERKNKIRMISSFLA